MLFMMPISSKHAAPQAPPPALRIERSDPGGARARALIGELDAYQRSLYPAESNHLIPVEALRQPGVVFLLASFGVEAAGCAALVDRDGIYGEIKRMYVPPAGRGRGVGRALLQHLVVQARLLGLRWLRLETGIEQPEAIALYESAGFRRRGPFGEYREDPLSLFMELDLR